MASWRMRLPMYAELYSKPLLVLGCGNTLLGDDGFGPAVILHLLARRQLPEAAVAVDVGTSIREILFDLLLAPDKPLKILVIDAADQPGNKPGSLLDLAIGEISQQKIADFSLHQFPSLNLLHELQVLGGVEVRVLAVQVASIPAEVRPGLSAPVAAAIPRACRWVLDQLQAAGEPPLINLSSPAC